MSKRVVWRNAIILFAVGELRSGGFFKCADAGKSDITSLLHTRVGHSTARTPILLLFTLAHYGSGRSCMERVERMERIGFAHSTMQTVGLSKLDALPWAVRGIAWDPRVRHPDEGMALWES